jgi:hypothetical protein
MTDNGVYVYGDDESVRKSAFLNLHPILRNRKKRVTARLVPQSWNKVRFLPPKVKYPR